MDERLGLALRRFDEANAEDPRSEVVDGAPVPRELAYGRRMSLWLERLEPQASEALRLAVRAQHLQRWRIPREQYPEGRTGYKRWRTELARMHAELAGRILAEVGYDVDTIGRVGDLITKRRLASDPEAQTLEDVACLVFLEHYFAEFADKHDDTKLIDIVRKTWRKMSERGRHEALGLPLSERGRHIVARALASE